MSRSSSKKPLMMTTGLCELRLYKSRILGTSANGARVSFLFLRTPAQEFAIGLLLPTCGWSEAFGNLRARGPTAAFRV